MPESYNPRVIDHLVRPRHAGRLEDPSGTGESGDAACGDVARFTVLVREDTVEDVRYEVFGCAACVAAGSALAELVSGRSLLDAARVSKGDVEGATGPTAVHDLGEGMDLELVVWTVQVPGGGTLTDRGAGLDTDGDGTVDVSLTPPSTG